MSLLNFPGVPALLNKLPIPSFGSLLSQDAHIPGLSARQAQWGIFRSGSTEALVIEPDSVLSLDYRKEWRIADYPQEQGAFESYNKVTTPFYARVRLSKGGNSAARQAFLDAIDAAAASLDLYDIVTPEKTYVNVNIAHVDYIRRADHGLGLITVDLALVEIRVTVAVGASDTAAPSGADPISVGTCQVQIPSIAQASGISNLLSGFAPSGINLSSLTKLSASFNLHGVVASVTGKLGISNLQSSYQSILSGAAIPGLSLSKLTSFAGSMSVSVLNSKGFSGLRLPQIQNLSSMLTTAVRARFSL